MASAVPARRLHPAGRARPAYSTPSNWWSTFCPVTSWWPPGASVSGEVTSPLGSDSFAWAGPVAWTCATAAAVVAAVCFLGRAAHRCLQFLVRPGARLRQVQFGLQDGERCPELVARVIDEPALPVECGLQPAQHGVESVPEPRYLVSAGRDRQPAPRLGSPLRPCQLRRGGPRLPCAAFRRRAGNTGNLR
jgi:hypothetical protein